MPWYEALGQPGAGQMQHRRLLESRPILTRIPDDSVIVTDRVATSDPAQAATGSSPPATRPASTRWSTSPWAVRSRSAWMQSRGPRVKAWWFDPRTGQARPIDEFPATGVHRFIPPDPGELSDWVLVLDDAARGYPPPGQASAR